MAEEKLSKSISNLKDLEEKFLAERKGEFNILYEIGRDDRENYNSDILAFLLDPNREHFHPKYFELFLEQMKIERPDRGSVIVTREKSTDKRRKIDIVIEADKWILGIECKINDTEQSNQLHDYAEDLISKAKKKNKIPYLFFLTRGDTKETSLTGSDKKKLSNNYKNITWKDDILPWLKKLTVKDDEELLKSGLRQYIDSVEIFTREKDWGKIPLIMILEAAQKVSKALGQSNQNIELVLGISNKSLKTAPFTVDEFMKNNHYWVGCKIPSKGDIYLAYHDETKYYYLCAKDETSFNKKIKLVFDDKGGYPWVWLADFGNKLDTEKIISLIRALDHHLFKF